MDSRLSELLKEVSIKNCTEPTHQALWGPRALYQIRPGSFGKFWSGYCSLVFESDDLKNPLAEVPISPEIPIVADILVKYKYSEKDSYNYSSPIIFIKAVIYCYQQMITKMYELSPSKSEYICCVLEPEEYDIHEGFLHVTFRLIFPYCRVNKNLLKTTIRDGVIACAKENNILGILGQQPENNWDSKIHPIVDPFVTDNPWMLYKAVEAMGREPKLLTDIYAHVNKAAGYKANTVSLEKAFLPTKHGHFDNGQANKAILDEEEDKEFWLPMFLSLSYWPKVAKLNKMSQMSDKRSSRSSSPIWNSPTSTTQTFSTMSQDNMPMASSSMALIEDINSDDPRVMVHYLLPLLSMERATLEHFWADVGQALYQIYNGCQQGLEKWISFSKRSDQFGLSECKQAWYKMRTQPNKRISIKTIAWYARQDNFKAYQDWHKRWYKKCLIEALDCGDATIAHALYRVYWLDYLCSNPKRNTWWRYNRHTWTTMNDATKLRMKISREFKKIFLGLQVRISQDALNTENQDEQERKQMTMKRIGRLITKLGKNASKRAIISEVKGYFEHEDFDKFADKNGILTGVLNGVVEARSKYATFRSGKPEDFITSVCPVFWDNDILGWNHPMVKKVMLWMRQMFHTNDLIDHVIKLMSSGLTSGNDIKSFLVMTGAGDNSKSMFKHLIDALFGSLSVDFPLSIMLGKHSNSSGPNPELNQASVSRFAWICEPGQNARLDGGTIKKHTGGDSYFARGCNEDGGKHSATFLSILMCNKIPSIIGADKATIKRVKIIPFDSKWVENPPKTPEEQYKTRRYRLNEGFKYEIPEMAPAFLWILVQSYAKYKREGAKPPKSVIEKTKKYWEENDPYIMFRKDRIELAVVPGSITEDNQQGEIDRTARMTLVDVYNEFKEWWSNTFPGTRIPLRNDVKYQLDQRWKGFARGAWWGIKPKDIMTEFNDFNSFNN